MPKAMTTLMTTRVRPRARMEAIMVPEVCGGRGRRWEKEGQEEGGTDRYT